MALSFSLNSLAHSPPWLLLWGCILPLPSLPLAGVCEAAVAVQPPAGGEVALPHLGCASALLAAPAGSAGGSCWACGGGCCASGALACACGAFASVAFTAGAIAGVCGALTAGVSGAFTATAGVSGAFTAGAFALASGGCYSFCQAWCFSWFFSLVGPPPLVLSCVAFPAPVAAPALPPTHGCTGLVSRVLGLRAFQTAAVSRVLALLC